MQSIPRPTRILIVCDGNTCRSPMAEAIARKLLGTTTEVQSVGIDTADGLPPTKHAVAVMQELGLDISQHRSCDIETVDLSGFELIIAMTPAIAQRLRVITSGPARIAQLDIPDPYCKGVDVYRLTAKSIALQLRHLFAFPN